MLDNYSHYTSLKASHLLASLQMLNIIEWILFILPTAQT